jgi:hypothetical protein
MGFMRGRCRLVLPGCMKKPEYGGFFLLGGFTLTGLRALHL